MKTFSLFQFLLSFCYAILFSFFVYLFSVNMKTPLSDSPYSRHFKMLLYLGVWKIETDNPLISRLYSAYQTLVSMIALCAIYSLLVDLYMVIGNFKKMAWNLCITTLFIGCTLKYIDTYHNNAIINGLRRELHDDAESRNTPEDILIHNLALRELKLLRVSFYGTSFVFIPIWLLSRYFSYLWGPRELPIPARFPFPFDSDDSFQYNFVFVILAFGGIVGLIFVIETELSMFGILIQISREYNVLLKDIPLINKLYEESSTWNAGDVKSVVSKQEFNPWLKKEKTKMMVKELAVRQRKLIRYTKDFEYCFNREMLYQYHATSLLITLTAIQGFMASLDFSADGSYQFGYLFILITDMFLICWFSTRIGSLCCKVGEAAYSTLWYCMDTDIQKDIGMMIMRSQHPTYLTAGKITVLTVSMFMHTMGNIYSWLALFRQLEFKGNE